MLWFSKIDKSISRDFAAEKVLSILNIPISNVSWTAHTKALEKAANELLKRELCQQRSATSEKKLA